MFFKNKIAKILFIILLFLAGSGFCFSIQAQTWIGSVSSDWNNGANWDDGEVPEQEADVIITSLGNRPVLSTEVTLGSLQLGSWSPGAGQTFLTVASGGDLTIADEMTFQSAGWLFIDGGDVNLIGSLGQGGNNNYIEMTSGSFTATEAVVLNGGTTTQPAFSAGNGTATFNGDVTLASGKVFNASNATIQMMENFNVLSGAVFNLGNSSLSVTGDTEIVGTFNGDDGITDFFGSGTVRSGGVANLNTGQITFHDTPFIGNNGTLNMGQGEVIFNDDVDVESSGFINVQDGTMTVTGNAIFRGNGNLSTDTGTINITENATLQNGGEINLNSGNLNVGGDATVTSGGTMNAGSSNINLQGNLSLQNSSNFNAETSTVTFSGSETQTVSVGNGNVTFHDVVVESGSTFQTDGGSANTIFIENNLTVNSGGTVNVQDNDQIDIVGTLNDEDEGVVSDKPFLRKIDTPNLTTVVLEFNKDMTSSVETISNYSINNGINITNAQQNSVNPRFVTLTVSTLTEGTTYEITVNNVETTEGGVITPNHLKLFNADTEVTFYSRQNGNWNINSTWSLSSHTGAAATQNPSNTPNSIIIVGSNHTVVVASTESITNQNSVTVTSNATLRASAGGTLQLGNKVITGGGTFEVTNGTINIGSSDGISASGATGNIQTGTRSFGTGGSYIYSGNSTQITGSGLPQTVDNLHIDNNNGVTLSNSVEANGTLFLTNGVLTVGDGLSLIAPAKNISNGQLRYQLQIAGQAGYRLLSSPINTDLDNFLSEILTQGFTGASLTGDLQPNVLWYDETVPGTDNQRWRAPTNSTNSAIAGQGYHVYMFDDVAGDTRYNDPLPYTLDVIGQENEGTGGTVDLQVTYTAEADTGWNLVGNPFGAAIDWNNSAGWTKENIDETIYIWDPNTNQYKTWNGLTGDITDGIIAPFQGFWVKANNVNPDLKVNQDAKTTGGDFVGKSNHTHPTFSIKAEYSKNHTSTVHFLFSESSSYGMDVYDAYKLLPPPGVSNYLELYSVSNEGKRLAINSLPRKFGKPIEIPIELNGYKDGDIITDEIKISIEDFKNIPEWWTVEIVNGTTGESYQLNDDSDYLFSSFSSAKSKGSSNHASGYSIVAKGDGGHASFMIRIRPGADSADLPGEFALTKNYPNPFNPSTTFQFEIPLQSSVKLEVYDMLGRRVAVLANEKLNAGTHERRWDASGLSSGVYIARLITSEGIFTRKTTLVK